MKTKYHVVALFALLLLSGCGGITGQVTAELEKDTIKNGETTTVIIDGINTAKNPADILLKIETEDSSKVVVSYPGSLEGTLQPDENTGKKMVKVQGFTDHTSTKYWIKIQLMNKNDGKKLDEKTVYLTVKK